LGLTITPTAISVLFLLSTAVRHRDFQPKPMSEPLTTTQKGRILNPGC
jgi:hypothetical protein